MNTAPEHRHAAGRSPHRVGPILILWAVSLGVLASGAMVAAVIGPAGEAPALAARQGVVVAGRATTGESAPARAVPRHTTATAR